MTRVAVLILLAVAVVAAQDGEIRGVAREPNGGRLLPSVEVTIVSDEAGARLYSTRSGADGRFLFDQLPYGDYTLSARKAGYEAGKPVTLSAAISDTDPAASVPVELRKSAVMAGQVTDPDGDPMVDIAVELYRWQTIRGRRRLVTSGSTTTNDLGEFRLHGLAPERYLLRINPLTLLVVRGVLAYEYSPSYFPGSFDAAGAQTVEVRWGAEIVGLDVQLDYAPRTAIEGRVLLADGTVCNECLVSVVGESKEMVASVTVRTDGSFALRGLPAKDYDLVALPRRSEGGNAVLPVQLREGEPTSVAMTVGPARTVSGRALFGPGSAAREPVKYGVRLDAAAGAVFTRGRAAQSNAAVDGSFVVKEVVPGEYDLSVSGLPDGVYLDSVRVGGQPLPGATLTVPSEYDLTDVDLRLADDGGEVSGVVDPSNSAVPGQVAPLGVAALIPIPYGGRGRFELLASYRPEDGQFLFRAVPPGDYTLVAVPTSNRFDLGEPADVELLRRGGKRVEVRPGQSLSTEAPFVPDRD